MKIIAILMIASFLLISCAHTPHPYKTGTYDYEKTAHVRELRNLTHADAPAMPDDRRQWERPMPFFEVVKMVTGILLGIVIVGFGSAYWW